MKEVNLSHVFERVAQRFGLTLDQMRGVATKAHAAQIAYCYLARGLTGCSELAIGMKVARDAGWVVEACKEAAHRAIAEDRAFAETLAEIEIECLVEAGVSDRTLYPLPKLADPSQIATRIVASPREAMQVGIADLQTLGAAYLALERENARPVVNAEIAALVDAVAAFRNADFAARQARFTNAERAAWATRETALQTLFKLIGTDNGQTDKNARLQPARAAVG